MPGPSLSLKAQWLPEPDKVYLRLIVDTNCQKGVYYQKTGAGEAIEPVWSPGLEGARKDIFIDENGQPVSNPSDDDFRQGRLFDNPPYKGQAPRRVVYIEPEDLKRDSWPFQAHYHADVVKFYFLDGALKETVEDHTGHQYFDDPGTSVLIDDPSEWQRAWNAVAEPLLMAGTPEAKLTPWRDAAIGYFKIRFGIDPMSGP